MNYFKAVGSSYSCPWQWRA